MGLTVEKPLTGIKVLEFAQLVAGPSAGQMLVDLGAEVSKVEPLQGDRGRKLGQGEALYKSWNSGKRSIALDIKRMDGLAVAERLASQHDVIVESFRPGVLGRLGLGYEQLSLGRPELIYASVAGFSFEGNGRARRGVDAIIQAESGIMSLTGERGGEPLKVGFQLVDTAAGLALGQALLAAVLYRERTGKGSQLQTSLHNAALYLQAHQFTEYSISQVVPARWGNAVAYGYPTDLFHTVDGALEVAAYFPEHWLALCDILGLGDLATDPRFATNLARIANHDELFEILSRCFLKETNAYWIRELEAHGLMVGQIRDLESVLKGPYGESSGSFVKVTANGEGDSKDYVTVQLPYESSEWALPTREPAPALGANTVEILQRAGYNEEQITALRVKGIIHCIDDR